MPTKEKPADAACRADGPMNTERPKYMSKEMGQLALPKAAPVAISIDNHGVQLRSFDELGRFCKAVINSGLAPKSFNSPEAVMVAIQHGMELGLAPMQALQSIAIVNGKPVVYGDTALAIATAHPAFLDIEEKVERNGTADGHVATCIVKRRDRSAVVRTFSESDAKKAGLWGKSGPWQQYPDRMLQMRARSWALRDAFPDALRGLGIREEVQDYQVKQARGREVASGVVLPELPTTAHAYFSQAVDKVAAASGLGDLFEEVSK